MPEHSPTLSQTETGSALDANRKSIQLPGLSITRQMNQEFRAYAEGRGLTLSEAMRHAIQLYIDDPEPATLTPDERKEVRRLAREQYAHLVAEQMPPMPPMPAIDPDAVMALVKEIVTERVEMAFRTASSPAVGDAAAGGTDMDLQRAS